MMHIVDGGIEKIGKDMEDKIKTTKVEIWNYCFCYDMNNAIIQIYSHNVCITTETIYHLFILLQDKVGHN